MNENKTRSNGVIFLPKWFNTRVCVDFVTYIICNVCRLFPRIIGSGLVDTFKRRFDMIIPDLNY